MRRSARFDADVRSGTCRSPTRTCWPCRCTCGSWALRDFPPRPMGLIHLSNVDRVALANSPPVISRRHPRWRPATTSCTDVGPGFRHGHRDLRSGGRLAVAGDLRIPVTLARGHVALDRAVVRRGRPRHRKTVLVLAELDVSSLRTGLGVRARLQPTTTRFTSVTGRRGFSDCAGRSGTACGRSRAASRRAPCAPSIPHGVRIETQFLTPVQLPARVAIKEWPRRGPGEARPVRHPHRARAHVRVVAGRRRDGVNARGIGRGIG